MITTLEKLGLSEKEAKVYLAILELGSESVQNIAKKAQVNRATTYVILETLAKKGLSSYYEKGIKTFFTAESPEQLDRLIKEKEKQLNIERKEFEKLIPELKAIYNLAGGKPKVMFFEGKEGLIEMDKFESNLSQMSKKIYSFTPLDLYLQFFSKNKLTSKRIQEKIELNVIYTHKNGPVPNATNTKEFRIARFVPRNKFPFQSMIDIYPHRAISINDYSRNFCGVIIENSEIAQTFKAIFDLAWEAAEKYNH